ncbi:MAG TPA: putative Ig domain-containing protein [Gaiellaceae bacterium]|nr:putative Ig domain-containing protein [Gaiellaceae bacterium]
MRGVLAFFVAVLALSASTAHAAARDAPHVTLIGDSVADAIGETNNAIATIKQGVDMDFELAPCRRVEGEGCPVNGVRPPSVVDLAKAMGTKLGANVVVSVGYNDYEAQYAQNIDDALNAFKAAGVKHVWWLTLRAAHHPYLSMNDAIVAAAKTHPELTVIDWNVYSRSHTDWFQDDGLHLLQPGAEAMATLIHTTLLDDGVALKPVQVDTATLPAARRGKPYTARLKASSGLSPYRWSLLERAPKGLHLEADGRIIGKALAKPGAYAFNVRVKDSAASFDVRRLTLRIKQ